MEWQHASFGSEPSQADVDACNQLAFYEAQRQAFFFDAGWPRFYGPPWGRPWHGRHWVRHPGPWPRASMSDRFFLERDLFGFCMRAKGYRLVPAPDD
jgi:hypothetical protein